MYIYQNFTELNELVLVSDTQMYTNSVLIYIYIFIILIRT